jgi:V8-like Glu-specific endopeptidase
MNQMSESIRPEILILEDDPRILRKHQEELEVAGFQCYPTCWAEEAIILVSNKPSIRFALIDIILCIPTALEPDMQTSLMYVTEDLQSLNGEGVVRKINSIKPRLDIKFIFITFAPEQRSKGELITLKDEEKKLRKFRGVIDVIHRYQLSNEDGKQIYGRIISQINHHHCQTTKPVSLIRQDSAIVNCAKSVCQIQIHQILHTRSNQVAHVELGTGWLIAPSFILTCWHLFEKPEDEIWLTERSEIDLEATITASQVTFGYLASGTGTHYKIAELVAWNSQLDYALLSLSDRQDIPLNSYTPLQLDQGDPTTSHPDLVVIQHPQNHPQCSSKGWYVQPSLGKDSTHILYKAQTDQGTSGAPVINLSSFEVTALHTGITQLKGKKYELQEAVLVKAIKEDLRKQPEIYSKVFDV